MRKTKVLIIVEGGIVQNVLSTDPKIEYVVVDYDNNGDDPVIVSQPSNPEKIKTEKVYELYKGFKQKDGYVDEDEKFVYEALKDEKF